MKRRKINNKKRPILGPGLWWIDGHIMDKSIDSYGDRLIEKQRERESQTKNSKARTTTLVILRPFRL